MKKKLIDLIDIKNKNIDEVAKEALESIMEEELINDPEFAAAVDAEIRTLMGEDYVEKVVEGDMTEEEFEKRWNINNDK